MLLVVGVDELPTYEVGRAEAGVDGGTDDVYAVLLEETCGNGD